MANFPLKSLLCLLFLFQGCAPEPQGLPDATDDHRQYWNDSVVRYCEGWPAKEHCDDGDSVIFNGLLCLSGDDRGCDAVAASQADDGRWWRSPRRTNGDLDSRNSFSRDQAYGVVAYLLRTGDTAAATAWMDWILDNRACAVTNPATGGCSVPAPLYRFCRDEEGLTCSLTPGWWAFLGRVFDYLGLERNRPMRTAGDADVKTLVAETALTDTGYALHLKGVQILLKQYMNVNRNNRRAVTDVIIARQPDNPFFAFLDQGSSNALMERVLDLCPSPGQDDDFRRFQWSWERDTASEAWRESMGWDCLFLTNLLLEPEGFDPH